ncbi:O-antigen polysaccharide polymerase Wzy [Terricaulis sp.]|uniref:O-antigen polysaccharide polymerase Wzy n=1 Tax=Terricaulis sp. TaxID=2768686 RepID=UPI002AC72930|nr:O-antigen polysaccharide polymerase Wzy [Terricaulis sp.]MDZ4690006.1 O-antigen polysaccharide polymerase Wzy [Terricaulis sp.]
MLFDAPISILTGALLAGILLWSARATALGALSLPAVFAITGLTYFYLMPALAAATEQTAFGLRLETLEHAHALVFLYGAGAALAFAYAKPTLAHSLAKSRAESIHNPWANKLLWGLAILGIAYLAASSRLNLLAQSEFTLDRDAISQFAFINQAFNLLLPLVLISLWRNKFNLTSLLILIAACAIFLQAGFRFRIAILLCASVTLYFVQQNKRPTLIAASLATIAGIYIVNLIGQIRRYGQGLDLSRLDTSAGQNVFASFGGELSIVTVTERLAENPPNTLITFDPWLIAASRLVPSFIWPDKPEAHYLSLYPAALGVEGARGAGVAAPQQAEFLLQFGWLGVAPLSFLYFSVACGIYKALLRRGRDAAVVGACLIPAFFGYYMQTRGYFFQILIDGAFIIAPIFLIYSTKRAQQALQT